jgi:hypothetical protein
MEGFMWNRTDNFIIADNISVRLGRVHVYIFFVFCYNLKIIRSTTIFWNFKIHKIFSITL